MLWSLFLFGFLAHIDFVIAFFDIDEINSVHYGIEILKEPILLPKENIPQSVQLKSKFGQQYQCSFPDHNEQVKLNEEVEKVAMETGIPELLRPLGTRPCLFKTKDWWSYEFCYGKYIRQYHMEDHKPVGDIIYLGYFESEYDWQNTTKEEMALRKKHEQHRYHSQRYVNGTKCDLNGVGRKTEVRFMCEEVNGAYISQIDEPETCVYVLTVYTAAICHHPYLKAPTPSRPISITCNPVLGQEQYDAYLEHVQNEEKRKAEKREKSFMKLEESKLPGKELPSVDLSKSLKVHLARSSEEVTAMFKEMLSSSVSHTTEKPAGKSLFTADDNDGAESAEENQLHTVPSHQEEEKEDPHLQEETDNVVKDVEDERTESSIITTDTSDASPTSASDDNQDLADDEFSGGLNKEISEEMQRFENTKKLHSLLQTQYKKVLKETENILIKEYSEYKDRSQGVAKKLADTHKSFNKLDKIEKEMRIVDNMVKHHRKAVEKYQTTVDKTSTSDPNSEDHLEEEKEKKEEETDSASSQNKANEDEPVKGETRIKVRVTKIRSGSGEGKEVNNENLEQDLPAEEKQKLEQSVKEGLESAGLESLGDKIQVRIITTGYYDSDKTLKVLSDEDTTAFKNMIVAILSDNDETAKETERYKQLEENYSFVWQNNKQTKKSPPK